VEQVAEVLSPASLEEGAHVVSEKLVILGQVAEVLDAMMTEEGAQVIRLESMVQVLKLKESCCAVGVGGCLSLTGVHPAACACDGFILCF
jgi:hypothetical protein